MNTALKEDKSRLSKSFTWLNATQFLGALNDNIFKLLIIFFLIGARGGNDAGLISAVSGAVFVIPFLLFSAASGIIADRISKKNIIVIVKAVEVAVMFLGTAAFFAGSELGLYLILFLMAAQSALFGPSKYGIVPELVRTDQLSRANSYLESFTYLAVILGSALAPMLSQAMSLNYERAAVFCVGIAAAGLLTSFKIEATAPAGSTKKVTPFFIRDIWETLKSIRQDRYLFMTVLGSAYFMFIGAFIQINLIPYGMETLKLTQEQSGYLFFAAALGIGSGSFLSGRLSGRNIEFGVVPLGALGLSLSAIALSLNPLKLSTVIIEVLIMGVSAGLYIVPLYSFIQFRSPAAQRGEILAASGFLGWSGVLLASGLVYLLSGPMGISAAGGFLIIGFITMVLTLITMKVLPDFFARFIVIMITKLCYRIRVIGAENIPMEGPALLVPNHVSWADPVLLTATTQRRIRFVMQREFYNTWYLKPVFNLAGVIPISPDDPPKAIASSIKQARAALDDGYMVCIFAEGSITRSGFMHTFKEGMEKILKRRDCPVIPVYLGGVWGSIFSYAHGKLLSRMPVKFPYPVTVLFGQSLPSTCSADQVRQAVTELSSEYVNSKKQYRKSLGEELVKSARRHWKGRAVSDTTGINLSYGKMMTAVIALAAKIKRETGGQEKVGVLLPTTVGGALVNLSLALLGKVPVNLNYTASPESIQSAIDQCSIRTTITSKAFLEKTGRLPLSAKVLYIEDLKGSLSQAAKAYAWLKARYLPLCLFIRKTGFKADDPAAVIFSSGSTGEPKGVVLSHHNILSNVESVRMVLRPRTDDNMCSALPFFHSLGFTATIWLPLLSGSSVTYHFNPVDGKKIAEVVRKQRSTILLSAPTFLLSYIRRAERADFASLRLVVTGAEKLKERIAGSFYKKFGIRPLEGYGATEMSPVIALSLPDIEIDGVRQAGSKEGSVGHPLPGVAVRIVDPETGETLPAGEIGLIMAKGPNVMLGYLNRPELTDDAIRDGWYNTGDIGRVDRDGFLFITDRIVRFSKIGGEMVPHEGIEDEFHTRLNQSGQVLAVSAIPDERKGEKLVVLFTKEAGDKETLQKIMAESSLPNLWKPNGDCYVMIDELPVLGSGKTDLKKLRELALDGVADSQ